jgi:hypothetical protein
MADGQTGTTTGTITEFAKKESGGSKVKVATSDGATLTLHIPKNRPQPEGPGGLITAQWQEWKPDDPTYQGNWMKMVREWKPASESKNGTGPDFFTLATEPIVAAMASKGIQLFTDEMAGHITANYRFLEALHQDLGKELPPSSDAEPEPESW